MHSSLVYLLNIWSVFKANMFDFDFKFICIIITVIINNNFTCSSHTQIAITICMV